MTRARYLAETAAGLALGACIWGGFALVGPFVIAWEMACGAAHPEERERSRVRGWAPRPSIYSDGQTVS
jgi:hypothetical protein